MYSALLSKRTKTLLTSPILNPTKTPVANKSKTGKLATWFYRAKRRWLNPDYWPAIVNVWADRGSKWSYALLKWEEREKAMDAIKGPRHPDQYPAKLVVEKFKEEDAPIKEWEEDIASSDPLAEPPYNRIISTWRKRMRRQRWRANYARLISKFSQPAIYEDTRQLIYEAMNKETSTTSTSTPSDQISEEEVERRENFILSLFNPLAGVRESLWKLNYDMTRQREISLLQANALSQVSRLIEVALPSLSERAKQSRLREEHSYYADKITEAIKTPPPGQTQIYPYSFSPPGYQDPDPSFLHPYDKLPYKDPNKEYEISPSNSFQIKADLNGSIWNTIKNSVNSVIYGSTGGNYETPLSRSQKIEESILKNTSTSNNNNSSKETSLVPIEPEEDAPRFMDFVNPKYSTFRMQDFNARHRDIKIATLKDMLPEFSKQSLRLEVIYGLFPKLLSILYGQYNPIDVIKYCDAHLASRLLNKARRDLIHNVTSFHKIIKILKTRFKITRRKSRRIRLKVKIRSIEMIARRKLHKPFFGNVNHMYFYKTVMWFTPNPMEPFKWKLLRFWRRRKYIRRRIHDQKQYALFRMVSKLREKVRKSKRIIRRRRRRTLRRKIKKMKKIMGYDPNHVTFNSAQNQIIKDNIRWPGRFKFSTSLQDKEYAEYMKKKYGIVHEAELNFDDEQLHARVAEGKKAAEAPKESDKEGNTNQEENKSRE